MQKINIKNICIQVLKPGRLFVMLKKVFKRLMDDQGHHSKSQNLEWIEQHSSDFKELATRLDATLWGETEKVSKTLEKSIENTFKKLEHGFGGGGVYPFLYFLTRYMKPNCIVETGVAAGCSSYAFLLAIKANGHGRLHSSDFPYFRLPNPEQYIGVVVDNALKDNWDLHIDGDEKNLPRILSKIDKIGIFHYDSDKSYSGRKKVMSMIENALDKDGIILMDDIQDNSYFYDYIEKNNPQSWHIFEFQGKYVGMVGGATPSRSQGPTGSS